MTVAPDTGRLSGADQRRGMRLVYWGQGIGATLTMLLMQSALGVLLIKHLGGTDFQAMLLGSMLLLSRVLQIPVSLIVPPSQGKRFMLICWLLNGFAMLAVLGVTFLPIENRLMVRLILVLLGLGSVVLMSGTTFWFPLLHDVVPDDQRGRFFGRMRMLWSIGMFVATMLIGLYLGPAPPLWKFRVVLAVGLVTYFFRNWVIAHLPEARHGVIDTDYSDWKLYVRQILSRKDVLIFCGYYALLGHCVGYLGTPLVLYMKEMGFQVGGNVIVFGFKMLGQALSFLVAGILADRIGTKRVFMLAHIVLCAVCVGVVWIGWLPQRQAGYLMPVIMVVSGGMVAMTSVACSAQLFHLAPDRGRAFFMSLSMIVMTAGMALSPLVAGWVRGSVPAGWRWAVGGVDMDIFQVVLACAGIGMLAVMTVLFFVDDVRPVRDRASNPSAKSC